MAADDLPWSKYLTRAPVRRAVRDHAPAVRQSVDVGPVCERCSDAGGAGHKRCDDEECRCMCRRVWERERAALYRCDSCGATGSVVVGMRCSCVRARWSRVKGGGA